MAMLRVFWRSLSVGCNIFAIFWSPSIRLRALVPYSCATLLALAIALAFALALLHLPTTLFRHRLTTTTADDIDVAKAQKFETVTLEEQFPPSVAGELRQDPGEHLRRIEHLTCEKELL